MWGLRNMQNETSRALGTACLGKTLIWRQFVQGISVLTISPPRRVLTVQTFF